MVTRHTEMTPSVPFGLGWGLGTLGTTQQIEGIAAAGASTTVGILVSLGTIGGPVGAVAAGLIAIGSVIANMFHGCGQTCVVAAQDANKVESVLKQNLDTYMSAPVHHASLQAAAANNATTMFAALRQACADPQLGAAGQRCISERLVRGGTAPWCPKPGHTGCDWYALYYDPIVNDPSVVPDPAPIDSLMVSTATGGGSSSSAGGGSPLTLGSFSLLDIALLGGGLLLLTMGGTSK